MHDVLVKLGRLCVLLLWYINCLCFKFVHEDFQWNISTKIKQRHYCLNRRKTTSKGLGGCLVNLKMSLEQAWGSGGHRTWGSNFGVPSTWAPRQKSSSPRGLDSTHQVQANLVDYLIPSLKLALRVDAYFIPTHLLRKLNTESYTAYQRALAY